MELSASTSCALPSSRRLLEFKNQIKTIVEKCHSSYMDPYYTHDIFSKLASFLKKEKNQDFKDDIWEIVKRWIDEFRAPLLQQQVLGSVDILGINNKEKDDRTEESSSCPSSLKSKDSTDSSSCSSMAISDNNSKTYPRMSRNEKNFKYLVKYFTFYIAEIRSQTEGAIKASHILRFHECLSVLQENSFQPLLTVLWKKFFSNEIDDPSKYDFKPTASTIKLFDECVSGDDKICFLCGANTTVKANTFKQHIAEIHSIWWFECEFYPDTCDYTGGVKRYLDMHMNTKHYTCHHCGATFENSKQVKNHLEDIHGPKYGKKARESMKENVDQPRIKKRKRDNSLDSEGFIKVRANQSDMDLNSNGIGKSVEHRLKSSVSVALTQDQTAVEKLKKFISIEGRNCKLDVVDRLNPETGILEPVLTIVKELRSTASIATQTSSIMDDGYSHPNLFAVNEGQSSISTPPSTPTQTKDNENVFCFGNWGYVPECQMYDIPNDVFDEIDVINANESQ